MSRLYKEIKFILTKNLLWPFMTSIFIPATKQPVHISDRNVKHLFASTKYLENIYFIV